MCALWPIRSQLARFNERTCCARHLYRLLTQNIRSMHHVAICTQVGGAMAPIWPDYFSEAAAGVVMVVDAGGCFLLSCFPRLLLLAFVVVPGAVACTPDAGSVSKHISAASCGMPFICFRLLVSAAPRGCCAALQATRPHLPLLQWSCMSCWHTRHYMCVACNL